MSRWLLPPSWFWGTRLTDLGPPPRKNSDLYLDSMDRPLGRYGLPYLGISIIGASPTLTYNIEILCVCAYVYFGISFVLYCIYGKRRISLGEISHVSYFRSVRVCIYFQLALAPGNEASSTRLCVSPRRKTWERGYFPLDCVLVPGGKPGNEATFH